MMSLERALMVPTLLSIFINELGKVLHKVMFADWTELFRKVKIIKLITKICRIILWNQTVDMCKEVNLRKITLTLTITLSKDPSWNYCGLFYETVISILSMIQKSKQRIIRQRQPLDIFIAKQYQWCSHILGFACCCGCLWCTEKI